MKMMWRLKWNLWQVINTKSMPLAHRRNGNRKMEKRTVARAKMLIIIHLECISFVQHTVDIFGADE